MNPSTFGGWFNQTRLASQVLSVRVLHSNVTIRSYAGTSVLPFRGTMGLLGIITALEICIRRDTGLFMTKQTLDMGITNAPYQPTKVKSFLQNIVTNNDGANFFYMSRIDTLFAHVMKWHENTDYNYTATQSWYDTVRKDPNKESTYNKVLQTMIDHTHWRRTGTYGRVVQYASLLLVAKNINDQAIMPNDGYSMFYYLPPNFEQVAYFIKCDTDYCIDEMTTLVDVTRTYLRERCYQNLESQFIDIYLFWRVFSVEENERTFEHLPGPGYYIGAKLHTF